MVNFSYSSNIHYKLVESVQPSYPHGYLHGYPHSYSQQVGSDKYNHYDYMEKSGEAYLNEMGDYYDGPNSNELGYGNYSGHRIHRISEEPH